MWSRGNLIGALAFALVAAGAPLLPQWLVSLSTIAFANALVVLGLVILWRTGLVPFGQALFYAIGAYAVALIGRYTPVRDVFVVVLAGAVCAGIVAYLVGFLLARYREIFFAMLSMALSMILYGILVRSAALGSTDGFNLSAPTFLGIAADGATGRLYIYSLAVIVTIGMAAALDRFIRSPAGVIGEAIQTNEIRIEYLGTSVTGVLHLTYVLGATAAGLGGALVALAAGHIDPDLAYWTTSGEFVFVAILSGTGHVAAPLLGMAVFETVRTFASQYLPYTWQMVVGISMLAVILFLPSGLWSLFVRARRRRGLP